MGAHFKALNALHIILTSVSAEWPSKTKHTLVTLRTPGIRLWESVWCHMATPNFTLINSLCCCFDLILLFKFVGFRKVLHFWGNIKMIIRKQSKLAQHPTNFLAPTNQNNNKGCWSGWSWGLPCGTKLTPESDSWRSEGHEYVFGFSRPSRTRLTLSQDGVWICRT